MPFTAPMIQAIAGVSTVLGLAGLFGYLYVHLILNKAEKSIGQAIDSDAYFTAQQILTILGQFKDDEHRFKALRELTRLSQYKTETLYGKIKNNVDLNQIYKIKTGSFGNISGLAGAFFVVMAGIAFAFNGRPPQELPVNATSPSLSGDSGGSIKSAPVIAGPAALRAVASAPAQVPSTNLAAAAASMQVSSAVARVLALPKVILPSASSAASAPAIGSPSSAALSRTRAVVKAPPSILQQRTTSKGPVQPTSIAGTTEHVVWAVNMSLRDVPDADLHRLANNYYFGPPYYCQIDPLTTRIHGCSESITACEANATVRNVCSSRPVTGYCFFVHEGSLGDRSLCYAQEGACASGMDKYITDKSAPRERDTYIFTACRRIDF